jgi:hypothetical protein
MWGGREETYIEAARSTVWQDPVGESHLPTPTTMSWSKTDARIEDEGKDRKVISGSSPPAWLALLLPPCQP